MCVLQYQVLDLWGMSLLRYDRSMSAAMSGNFLVFEKKTLKMLKDFYMVGECSAADFTEVSA